jgi:hypothetical protein
MYSQKPDCPAHLSRCRRCGRGSGGLLFQLYVHTCPVRGKFGSRTQRRDGADVSISRVTLLTGLYVLIHKRRPKSERRMGDITGSGAYGIP